MRFSLQPAPRDLTAFPGSTFEASRKLATHGKGHSVGRGCALGLAVCKKWWRQATATTPLKLSPIQRAGTLERKKNGRTADWRVTKPNSLWHSLENEKSEGRGGHHPSGWGEGRRGIHPNHLRLTPNPPPSPSYSAAKGVQTGYDWPAPLPSPRPPVPKETL